MLGASRVQISENNLDNLKLTREEDGKFETVDPQCLFGFEMLEGLDPKILGSLLKSTNFATLVFLRYILISGLVVVTDFKVVSLIGSILVRKPKRKDTHIPQPSDPIENVADEAVHKELGDSLVRAATTASSLEAEQDSGGGPRCQETMGDTIARTWFKNISKHSNDLLLVRGNTLRSDEDRLKLNELMALCTTLQNRVLDLEKTKTTQQNEIASLKRRVKKLEKKIDKAVHKELGDSLVRAATTASSLEAEQDSGGGPRCQETMGDTIARTRFKDISKHSNDLLLVRGNTLRSDEDRLKLNELMALCTTLQNRILDLEKTKTTQQNEIANRAESSVNEENLGEDASKQGRIDDIDVDEEITLVNVQNVDEEMFDVNVLDGEEVFVAEQEVAAKEKDDEVNVVEEVVEVINIAKIVSATTTTTATIITVDDITLAQALMEIKSIKPKEKRDKDLIRLDEEVALKLQAEFDEEERLAQEKAEKEKEANITLIETWDDIQKIRKHFAAKRAEEKRNKPPTKAQQRKIICTYLKNMEGYKLKDLKLKEFDSIQEMFDITFKRVNTFEDFRTELVADEEEVAIDAIPLAVKSPMEDIDLLLWGDLKSMFEPHIEDAVWRNQQAYKVLDWKLYDSCGGRIVRIKSLLDAVRITAAHVFVNASWLDLVLLVQIEVNAASENKLEVATASEYQVNAAS
ncbi:hypothetical protein Tco_0455602 [Tanacetum coccineum]